MTPQDRLARIANFAKLSAQLSLLSTEALTRMADEAEQLGSGIGGSTLTLNLDGIQVFAKRVRLTDLERRPENIQSTANLFGLPTHYQRNVGSAGFGVWRELAAHALANSWVLSGQLDCFPLMYHWRVLDGAAAPMAAPPPPDWTDVQGMSAYWADSAAVARRLTALEGATASVLILMEQLPWTLSAWLAQRVTAGPQALEAACDMVERSLLTDIAQINALGLLHGDAHHGNLLTDGQRLYYADLGLAMSARFALADDERLYLEQNASLDSAYVRSRWVNWLLKAWCPACSEVADRLALVKRIAQGEPARKLVPELPASIAGTIERHAGVADLVNQFYSRLHEQSRASPYPQAAIEAQLLQGRQTDQLSHQGVMMSQSKKLGAAATLASLACAAGCIADPASPAHFDNSASFSLKAGGHMQSRDGQVQVGFDGVSADSRCPKGVQCVWAGDATVRVWIRRGTGPKEHADLHTAAAAQQSLHSLGQQLSLLSLAPYPIAGKAIAACDYVATLTLAPSAEAESER